MATDNFEIIRQFAHNEESGITLNNMQQKMFDRWNTVIELKTCENFSQKQIIEKLMLTYQITLPTAMNDIGFAEALFGYSTPLNKRFRIGARINFLEEKINKLYEEKEFDAAAKLEASLVKYYDIYPELKTQQRPQILNFTYSGDKPLIENIMPPEDAEFVLLNNS